MRQTGVTDDELPAVGEKKEDGQLEDTKKKVMSLSQLRENGLGKRM